MNIVILGSALPIRFGHPRQRLAFGLRRILAQVADTRSLTIDCWNSEWKDRGFVLEGDDLYAHAKCDPNDPNVFLSKPLSQDKLLFNPVNPQEPVSAQWFQTGWMGKRRLERIVDSIVAGGGELVVISDPELFPLAPALTAGGLRVACLENGIAAWAEMASSQMRISEYSLWFDHLRNYLTENKPSPEGTEVGIFGLGAVGGSVGPLALPVEQEESELFLVKSNKLVVPSTGMIWLDAVLLGWLDGYRQHTLARGGKLADLVLIGFDPKLAKDFDFPEVERLTRWTRLHTMIGVARCLFMPFLTPWLRPFVDASLTVGTPVLTASTDARLYDLQGRPGLYDVTHDRLAAALAGILGGPASSEEQTKGISAAASVRMKDVNLADLFADTLGIDPTTGNTGGRALPSMRRLPLKSAPRVLYNPVTRMLLVQLDVRGWTGLEEVRLYDQGGTELTRLAPNTHQQSLPEYTLEGGIVTELDVLGGAVEIACYRDIDELYRVRIPVGEFETFSTGIVSMKLEEGAITGSLWIADEMCRGQLSLMLNDNEIPISDEDATQIDGLNISAVPFRVPRPILLPPKMRVGVNMFDEDTQKPVIIAQKPLEEKLTNLENPGLDSPGLAALKDLHVGQRAWIIGNGPSVRLEDLARIPKGDIVFCFNRFYLSYDDNPLREDYVVSADTLMIEDFGQDMIDISTGLPLFCIRPEQVSGLDGDCVRLIPGNASVPLFSYDPAQFVSVGGSSVFVALQMAWHMGLRDVVLYGMDYSFTAKLQRDPRFPFPVSYDEGNHFIKSYRSAKPWCPPTWRDISAGFLNARIAFELTGGRITNATRGGRLETFERVDFDEI